ncbi:MAG: MarR family winged helix-turn-helix transcriptional regulator [Dongiaceae bacterium]
MSERAARKLISDLSASDVADPGAARRDPAAAYRLDDQIGFLLRRATQRHLAIFAAGMGAGSQGDGRDLTPMQWAALAKLDEMGATPQNRLGRLTAMDGATVKGVVDRLFERGLIETRADPADRRRRVVVLTHEGARQVAQARSAAAAITEATLAPLAVSERATLLALLRKLA